ncbi:hypothetical protein, partial [uncultured Flavobacterium sp.]|uniref:beta strand repeat-containing protein n=1 Tax=uncultured Flavobacterium sp. TaxID=165435 RepID=UPI002599E5F4
MKKLLLTAIAILGASAAYSQVGIGTRTPNNSSQLEVTVDGQPEKRGILIPRVALQSTSSMNPIVNTGTLPNSLLVFNTAETGTAPFGVTPGFYYWYENKWIKMISNGDDTNTTNVSLTQNGQDLILTDSDGNNVRIALSDLQKITTLVNNNDGTYTYTNEAGTQVTIDVPADVVSNFNDIITNTSVLNQLITNLTNTSVGGNVYYDGTSFTYVDNTGTSHTITIQDIVRGNETVTTLINNNDGTYTYTNEAGTQVTIDVPADVVSNFNDIITNTSVLNQLITNLTNTSVGGNVYYDGTSFTYVDNTGTSHTINIQDIVRGNETVTTLVNNNDGTYTYTNEAGTQVTIDVPADVVSNFNDIITNTSVLNQLITNLTNTSVGGNVYYDGTSFTYVDNTGTSHTINIQDIVRGNETVTTLVDNNNGTYTYTSEDGTVTTIDVPADVIQNFQDIMNDNSVSTIVKNIIDANETLTILGYDPATKKLSYKDENGNTTLLDMSQLVTGNETVTTLVNNNDGTYTYTNEAGTQVTIDVPADVVSNFNDIITNTSVLNQLITNLTNTSVGGNVYYDGTSFTYVDNTGTSHTINIQDIVRGNETVTTLVDNNNGTYTYTSEDGTVTTIDVPADVIQNFQDIMNDNSVSTIVKNIIDANETLTILGYDPATKKLSYKDENGNTTLLDMSQLVTGNETVTTLVDNNNGTYTYTSEDGTVTTIDVPA